MKRCKICQKDLRSIIILSWYKLLRMVSKWVYTGNVYKIKMFKMLKLHQQNKIAIKVWLLQYLELNMYTPFTSTSCILCTKFSHFLTFIGAIGYLPTQWPYPLLTLDNYNTFQSHVTTFHNHKPIVIIYHKVISVFGKIYLLLHCFLLQ